MSATAQAGTGTVIQGCGAPVGGLPLDGVNVAIEAVVQGRVVRAATETPVDGAYVRLLDRSGEFTAEVRTSPEGHFRFFAGTGAWTLRTLAAGASTVDTSVDAVVGEVTEVVVAV